MSHNIEGLQSNKASLQFIIENIKPEIICLQETWLHSFQQHHVNEISEEYTSISKSLDEVRPLSQTALTRGSSGISIMSSSKLQTHPSPEGSHRTSTTLIADYNIRIINSYLPCRGHYTLDEFQQELDQIQELCQKYSSTPTIVAGDFNVDIHGKVDPRTKYFKNFINENALKEPITIKAPTFKQHSGNGQSKIDYIFINKELQNILIKAEYKILDVPPNCSSHVPLLLTLTLNSVPTASKETESKKRQPRLLWSKVNKDLYNDTIREYLSTDAPVADPSMAVKYLTNAMHKAAEIAVPKSSGKRRKAPYNPVIASLVKESKAAFQTWVEHDRPDIPDDTARERKLTYRKLRSAQRQQAAINRCKRLHTLHSAAEDNPKLMFSIIKEQRKTSAVITKDLIVNNHLYTGDILPGWVHHFSTLATPRENPNFTPNRILQASSNLEIIKEITPRQNPIPIPITTFEVHKTLKQLKPRKAADINNLVGEHIKTASRPIAQFLTPMINRMVEEGIYPEELKEGIKHPILKKNKIMNVSGNYRGISISPILGKILDNIHLGHQKAATPDRIHPLQFGFSEGKSCTHAAFLVSESMAECKDKGLTLYIAAIDVEKAFDVIRHESLLDRLYQLGLKGTWWRLKYSAYTELKERVKWLGQMSEAYDIFQGSKQGAYPSPEDYISHLCPALFMATKSELGLHIGTTNTSTPTCADDMVFMTTSPYQLQALLLLISTFANEEHYIIHPEKSIIIPYNMPSKAQLENIMATKPWTSNSNNIPVEEEVVHLGVRRNIHNPHAVIDDRTSTARKTLYSMMGSGLHGLNGLPVKTSVKLYNAYVVPRALYGLEAVRTTDSALDKLIKFHRYALRSILGLPKWTAVPALYILSGQIPIEFQLDAKILKFIHNLLTTDYIRDMVLRQYVVKCNKSNSLIIKFKEKLSKYQLPSITDIFVDPPTKNSWKQSVKQAVHREASRYIRELGEEKSTLKYLNKTFYNTPHPAALHVNNCRQVTRANVKLQLLSGTFPFKQARFKMRKSENDTCPLCEMAPEDTSHFIEDCPEMNSVRLQYKARINALLPHSTQMSTSVHLLDSRSLKAEYPQIDVEEIEAVTRDLMFAMSCKRSALIDNT